ncbi:hypothetical protein FACS1894190_05460 [Spirochaetia bacterium]|nr:hypothetical protein FACS1894190_05460 [Spirochaetia bacterium]
MNPISNIAEIKASLLNSLALRKVVYETNPIQVFMPAKAVNNSSATFVLCIPVLDKKSDAQHSADAAELIWCMNFALKFIDKVTETETPFDVRVVFLEDDNINDNFDEQDFFDDVNIENGTRLLFDEFDTYQNILMVYANFSKPPFQLDVLKSSGAAWNVPRNFIVPFFELCAAFKVPCVFTSRVRERPEFLTGWDYDFPLLTISGRDRGRFFNAKLEVLTVGQMAELFFQYAQNITAVFTGALNSNTDRNFSHIEIAGNNFFFSEFKTVLFLLFSAAGSFFIILLVPALVFRKRKNLIQRTQ